MQQSPGSRKRPAPGTSPRPMQRQSLPQQTAYQYPQQTPPDPDFLNYDFSAQPYAGDATFGDLTLPTATTNTTKPGNNFQYLQNASQPATYGSNVPPTSTDLVRRARNQPLAPAGGLQQEQWNGGYGNMHGDEESEQELAVKVEMAKRDAQGRKKQIPPFVQKLSSFLDSSHTDLIRWSDDGRSFIVLDEDEFARTLIPELFKHNNYASFVRQLNMYGFHKTVNITDGSLRQSEKARKGVKPPSMYSHPYFRKNRPDLLWLIQKPNTKGSSKRKRDGTVKDQYESDEERFSPAPVGMAGGGPVGELGAPGGSGDVAQLPRTELANVRRELQKLQTQQRYISQMITQLKEQNDQFYRQASAFQALHDRHENSINAILTFLATFYNRSLEGHGAQNLVNMFSNVAPNQAQHGSVEEVHDGAGESANKQLQRFVKRAPLLLPGPVANIQNQQQSGDAVTASSSARNSISPPNDGSKRNSTSPSVPPESARIKSSTASPVIKDDAPTPNLINQVPESDQMVSLINSINATNASAPGTAAPAFDFNSALEHYQTANGNAPLTPQQRDSMLALMANQHGGNTTKNNALLSPTPPQMPDLNQFKQTQQQLEMLTNMQKQQDERVQELNRRLQPLSPTGSIPGLANGGGDEDPFNITGAPGDYDPNAFIDFDNTAWPTAGSSDNLLDFDFGPAPEGADVDWDFNPDPGDGDMFQTATSTNAGGLAHPTPATGLEGSGGRVESVSSEATSPAHTVPESATVADGDDPGTPRKRARVST